MVWPFPTGNPRREAYIALLKAHDWSYQFSDDRGAWDLGRQERALLDSYAAMFDPGFSLWNTHAPEEYQR